MREEGETRFSSLGFIKKKSSLLEDFKEDEKLEEKHTAKCLSCSLKYAFNVVLKGEYGRVILRGDDQGPIGRAIYSPFDHIYSKYLLITKHKHVVEEMAQASFFL